MENETVKTADGTSRETFFECLEEDTELETPQIDNIRQTDKKWSNFFLTLMPYRLC